MGFFARLKAKPLKTLQAGAVTVSKAIQGRKQFKYECECVMMFEGKPMRKFSVTVLSSSHKFAKQRVADGIFIKVVKSQKVHQKPEKKEE